MPAVFRWKGYRFFFYSNEGDPREPLHVHVIKGDDTAKFWVEPVVSVAQSYGMTSSELTALSKVVEENTERIRKAWNDHFSR